MKKWGTLIEIFLRHLIHSLLLNSSASEIFQSLLFQENFILPALSLSHEICSNITPLEPLLTFSIIYSIYEDCSEWLVGEYFNRRTRFWKFHSKSQKKKLILFSGDDTVMVGKIIIPYHSVSSRLKLRQYPRRNTYKYQHLSISIFFWVGVPQLHFFIFFKIQLWYAIQKSVELSNCSQYYTVKEINYT